VSRSCATGFQTAAGIKPGVERMAVVHKEQVVRQALRAYEARRSICVPGAVSTITAAVSRLLPQRLVARTAGAAMRRMGRNRERA
jgi:short-subunit dehydrogenase